PRRSRAGPSRGACGCRPPGAGATPGRRASRRGVASRPALGPLELGLDDALVELGEDGRGRLDGRPGRDGPGLPREHARVVAGDDGVADPRIVEVGDLLDPRGGLDLTRAAEDLV